MADAENGGNGAKQRAQNPGGCAADIFGPFADVDADQIGAEGHPQEQQRASDHVIRIVGEPGVRRPEGINGDSQGEERAAGDEEGDAEPVNPEVEESGPGSEIVAGPQVEAAGAGIFGGESGHGDGQRDGQ